MLQARKSKGGKSVDACLSDDSIALTRTAEYTSTKGLLKECPRLLSSPLLSFGRNLGRLSVTEVSILDSSSKSRVSLNNVSVMPK